MDEQVGQVVRFDGIKELVFFVRVSFILHERGQIVVRDDNWDFGDASGRVFTSTGVRAGVVGS